MADVPAPAAPTEGVNLETPSQYDPYAAYQTTQPSAPKDPAQMERGEYWKGVASNLPKSAYENVAGTLHAIAPWNWGETAEGIGTIGTGIYSKAKGALGYEQAPEQKETDEAALNALIKPFTSKEEFYRTLYDDPASILSIGSIPVTAGAGAVGMGAKALGTASKAGRLASTAAKIGSGVGTLMDPTQTALGIAGKVGSAAKAGAKGAVSLGTGVAPAAYERAFQAGASQDPMIRGVFNVFARGEGDTNEFANAMSNAFRKIKDDEITAWAAKKKENFAALQQDASLQPIYDSLSSAKSKLSELGSNEISDEAHKALIKWENDLYRRSVLPSGNPERGIESLDKLKQDIGAAAQATKNPRVSAALWELYHGTKQAISDVSPEYSQMMDDYRTIQDSMKNISGTLGINKATANAQLQRTIRNFKTPMGNDVINAIGKVDPRVPYMAAGAALNDAISSGTVGKILEGGGGAFHLYNAGTSLAMGDPASALKHIGLLSAQAAFQSPRLMGATAYGAGRVAGSPVGKAASAGATGAGYATRALSPFEQNLNRAYEELYGQYKPTYATGGKVGDSLDAKADKLIALVDKVKKEQSKETESLLNLDDTTVAKALSIANRGI